MKLNTKGLSLLLVWALAWGCTSTTTVIDGVDGSGTAVDGTTNTNATDGVDGVDGTSGTTGNTTGGTGEIDSGIPSDPIEAVCSPQFFDIPVAEDVVCEETVNSNGSDFGGWPFAGASYSPPEGPNAATQYNWSCTTCPGGKFPLEGRYKYYIESADGTLLLDQPSPSEYMEVIEFRGNAWSLSAYWNDNGTIKRISERGYYFCPEPGTLPGVNSFYPDIWVRTKVVPEGALGSNSGEAFPLFLGVSTLSGSKNILFGLNNGWNQEGSLGETAGWCKIGTTVEGRECVDPCKQLATQ
jgi:hypothetical protein